MTTRRVHVQALDAELLTLDEEAAHYVRDVLRLETGAAVELFDGQGLAAPAAIEQLDRKRVTARLLAAPAASTAGEPPRPLIIAAAIPKGDRWEWLIEKVSEAGATAIWPLHTARGVVQIAANKAEDKVIRWQKIAAGAARQCHRSRAPDISPPRTVRAALDAADAANALLLVPHTGEARAPLMRVAAQAPPAQPIILWIGPEGGWTDEELDLLTTRGAKLVHLGPRILRAETAAVVACALAQAAAGDLNT